ncbi:unnamed protein product [Phaeothamnion confervicola]
MLIADGGTSCAPAGGPARLPPPTTTLSVNFDHITVSFEAAFGGDAAAAGSAALPVLLSLPNGDDDSKGEAASAGQQQQLAVETQEARRQAFAHQEQRRTYSADMRYTLDHAYEQLMRLQGMSPQLQCQFQVDIDHLVARYLALGMGGHGGGTDAASVNGAAAMVGRGSSEDDPSYLKNPEPHGRQLLGTKPKKRGRSPSGRDK